MSTYISSFVFTPLVHTSKQSKGQLSTTKAGKSFIVGLVHTFRMARTKQTARKSTNMRKKMLASASVGAAADKKPVVYAVTTGLRGPSSIGDEPRAEGAQVGFLSLLCELGTYRALPAVSVYPPLPYGHPPAPSSSSRGSVLLGRSPPTRQQRLIRRA